MNSFNSFLRTILAMTCVGGLGAAGWYGYSQYSENDRAFEEQDRLLRETSAQLDESNALLAQAKVDLETQKAEIATLNLQVEKLDTSLRLLKMDHRLARLRVLGKDETESGEITTTVEFVELNERGEEIGDPKLLSIEGDQIYLDYWVVKFDDEYVEQADLDRSTSIALFRRIFSEKRRPDEGYVLDDPDSMPASYATGGQPSEFERKIWQDFWLIANDRAKAEELGIRAAHGEAVSIKLETGRTYRLSLRASDGISITPEESPVGTAIER